MAYVFKQQLLDPKKYQLKSPYSMVAEEICVHNTYNDASAKNEVAYHNSNSNATSYHIAIDDKEVIQCLPFNRNGFHAGDGAKGRGNRKSIGIEICYSKSGGERYEKAEENAVKYIATLLKAYNWDISKVKKHQDYSGKYCPHRILDNKSWESFKSRISKELSMLKGENKPMTNTKKPQTVADWAKKSMEWAKVNGITDGNRPKDAITREEVWVMLERLNKLNK